MKMQAIIIIATLLSGCTAAMPYKELKFYEGENLPLNEVSSIAVDYIKGVSLAAVDGKLVPLWIDGNMQNWRGAHVLPGKHVLSLSGNFEKTGAFTTWMRQTIAVELQAGHTYIPILRKNDETGEIVFGVFDAGTNYNQSCLVAKYPDPFKERANASGCI
ncbi:hypothetical protein [Pseudomonas laurylsulfatiphila]|uniref:hypothetical protein n=1 Tax=Pseudomonas laurylsulfatiphila TaxID=2011015 RepID=UPI003D24E25F